MSGGSEAVLIHLSLEGRVESIVSRLSLSPLSPASLSRLSLSPFSRISLSHLSLSPLFLASLSRLSLWRVHVGGVGSGADADRGSACCVVLAEGPLEEVRRRVPARGRRY